MDTAIIDNKSLLLASGALLVFYAVARRLSHKRSHLPLPPGPKKLPLIGNLLDMPAERQWLRFHEWSQEFDSEIIHLDVAGASIVVIESLDAVRELFERRSSIYSDRGNYPMLVDLMGWDWGLGFMKYGESWRAHRKMLHDSFNITAVKQFRPQVTAAGHTLLRNLLAEPQADVMACFRQMAGSLSMDVAYGIQVKSKDDPYIEVVEVAMHGLSVASMPGAFLVDTIPLLKYIPRWFPRAGFKRQAATWRKATDTVVEVPFVETKRSIAAGTALPSFTSISLQNLDSAQTSQKLQDRLSDSDSESSPSPGAISIEDKEIVIRNTAANIYAAGADTTVAALGWFIFAMLQYPEKQKTAQAELDRVLGHGNLPTLEDQAQLPYVSALVKEVLRWRSVTPIAIPHTATVDDEYRGYRIPAGTMVIGNAWAVLHDKDIYPDPDPFKPERFLTNGQLDPSVRDPEIAAFGFGRRICPGKHLATASLWISIASILATLDIAKCRDEHGAEIEPSYDYFPGLISAPLPFKCSVTPRSQQAAQAIQATAEGI